MFGTSAVFPLPCGLRGFFRPKNGCLNQVWYRNSIDKEKSTDYTETALGKLRNKLEKKKQFVKQKNTTIYAPREKAGNNSSLRNQERLLRYGASP